MRGMPLEHVTHLFFLPAIDDANFKFDNLAKSFQP